MNINDQITSLLNESLAGMLADVQTVLIWAVGCVLVVVAYRLIKGAFDTMNDRDIDSSSEEGKEGLIKKHKKVF